MIKNSLMLGLLLFLSCHSIEQFQHLEKEKASVNIASESLYNRAFLGWAYYKKYGLKTVWHNYDDRQELIDFILERMESEGFSIDSYNIKQLCLAHINYQELDYKSQVQTDLDFTHAYLKAIHNLEFGKVNPKKFYSDWEVEKKRKLDIAHLKEALEKREVYTSLSHKIPTNLFYKNLRSEYNKLENLQSDKAKKIIVNMERSRWLPNDMGKYYVWVNLPEERLRVYEEGIETQSHKVIIGKKERKTPVLSSVFNQLVINPTWTVPPTILKKDLVPQANANRAYFSSRNISIIDKKTGAKVAPEDWNPERYNSYRYVQATGSANALGLIKFNFPNDYMVYLHDTNNRSLFASADRALSSGCVRVENPFSLAEKILAIEESQWKRSDLDTLVARKKTKFLPLKKIVHIHQTYLTAYVEEGQLKIFKDVYNLDDNLYRQLSKLK